MTRSVKSSSNTSFAKVSKSLFQRSLFGEDVSRQARLYRKVYEDKVLTSGSRLHQSNVSVLDATRPVVDPGSCLKETNLVRFEV